MGFQPRKLILPNSHFTLVGAEGRTAPDGLESPDLDWTRRFLL